MSLLREYERDTRLPARAGDVALCPPETSAFPALLHGVPGFLESPAVEARFEHLRWKPHVSCAALVSVRCADGSERLVTWKRYATDKAGHVALDAEHLRRRSETGRLAVLAGEPVVLSSFPEDRVLEGVERAFEMQRSCRILSETPAFAGLNVRHRRSTARLVRYKPERRAVIRYDVVARDAAENLVTVPVGVRVLSVEEARRAALARRNSGVSRFAPELIAHEERTGILFEAWWDVESLHHDDFGASREAGAFLARLHAMPVEGARVVPCAPARSIETALFECDRNTWAAARGFVESAVPFETDRAWVHGDFHPDQLARERRGGRLRVLDWDALRIDGVASELGGWIADALAMPQGPTRIADIAEREFLDGYERAGGRLPTPAVLDAAVAAALVARAAGALRRLEVGAVETAARLIDLARRRSTRTSGSRS